VASASALALDDRLDLQGLVFDGQIFQKLAVRLFNHLMGRIYLEEPVAAGSDQFSSSGAPITTRRPL